MPSYLFVYGTLLPEVAPPHLRSIVSRFSPLAPGSMPGRLYDLGDFPGAIYDPNSASRVVGCVFELPEDEAFTRQLDEYEGFVPGDAAASLFVRERRQVDLADGSHLQCWVYLYNRDPGSAPLVPDGDYIGGRNNQSISR